MRDALHIGMIGCGGIAATHLCAIKTVKGAKTVAFCDVEVDKAKKLAGEFGTPDARCYENYMELLADPDIDAVHIATPHYLHAEMALAALAAKKYVLLEKPMAIRKDDAKRLIEADSDGRLAIVFQNRYNAATVRAKEIIESGELGELLTISANVTWRRDAAYYASAPWRGKWATEGGGTLINQSIHTVDLLYYLGGPFEAVKGSVSLDVLRDVIEVEDNAHAVFRYATGMRALLHASNSLGVDNPAQVVLSFEKGTLDMHGANLWLRRGDEILPVVRPAETGFSAKIEYGNSHVNEIADFYACIREGRRFWLNGEEGYPALWAVLSIYESSKSDEWVRFDR